MNVHQWEGVDNELKFIHNHLISYLITIFLGLICIYRVTMLIWKNLNTCLGLAKSHDENLYIKVSRHFSLEVNGFTDAHKSSKYEKETETFMFRTVPSLH